MCYDPTSVNTGRIKGACSIIEKNLEQSLLYLRPRHNVIELCLGAAFAEIFKIASTGLDILWFKQFRDSWNNLDQTNYKSSLDDAFLQNLLNEQRGFVLEQLQKFIEIQPHRDYQELLDLTRIG